MQTAVVVLLVAAAAAYVLWTLLPAAWRLRGLERLQHAPGFGAADSRLGCWLRSRLAREQARTGAACGSCSVAPTRKH